MLPFALLPVVPVLLAAAQPATREVTFTTPDGFVLKGTLKVPARQGRCPVVILAHQFQATRAGWQPLVEALNAKGIATLALDLRGHGQSTQRGGATVEAAKDMAEAARTVRFDKLPEDLLQVAQWARRQPELDSRRLALAGSSLGAYGALMASALIHPVAVLALSPAGGWGEKPAEALAQAVQTAKAAVFVLASEEDPEADASAKAVQGLPGVYARIAPGKAHGFELLPELKDVMAGWLSEYLGHTYRVVKPKAEAKPKEEVPLAEEVK